MGCHYIFFINSLHMAHNKASCFHSRHSNSLEKRIFIPNDGCHPQTALRLHKNPTIVSSWKKRINRRILLFLEKRCYFTLVICDFNMEHDFEVLLFCDYHITYYLILIIVRILSALRLHFNCLFLKSFVTAVIEIKSPFRIL